MASGLYIERRRELHVGRWLFILLFISLVCATCWYAYRWFTAGEQPPLVPLPAAALANPNVDETTISDEDKSGHKVAKTSPRYISIPDIGVTDARVQEVGLAKTGELAMPKNIHDAGWYKEGAYPGQTYGTVLISGHCKGVERNGIFTRLDELTNGAEIIIERGDGKKFFYAVEENQTMYILDALKTGMDDLATPMDPETEGLGLITCAGNWVPRDGVFDHRILVRAVIK